MSDLTKLYVDRYVFFTVLVVCACAIGVFAVLPMIRPDLKHIGLCMPLPTLVGLIALMGYTDARRDIAVMTGTPTRL